jgi:hypothetical protein
MGQKIHGKIMKFFHKEVLKSWWIDELVLKRQEFFKTSKNVNTLVMGSSHGDYSFNPRYYTPGAYNFCWASQDLYYSYNVYLKLFQQAPNLNTVVLFFSVFSPGFDLYMTSEYLRCVVYKKIVDIDYKYKRRRLGSFEKQCEQYASKVNIFSDQNISGIMEKKRSSLKTQMLPVGLEHI